MKDYGIGVHLYMYLDRKKGLILVYDEVSPSLEQITLQIVPWNLPKEKNMEALYKFKWSTLKKRLNLVSSAKSIQIEIHNEVQRSKKKQIPICSRLPVHMPSSHIQRPHP